MERYRGGPMKGSSIIMAAWDYGGRGKLKGEKKTGMIMQGFCMEWNGG
jgi:hypothetical protein